MRKEKWCYWRQSAMCRWARRSDSAEYYEAWYHRPPGLWAAKLEGQVLMQLAGDVRGLRVLDAGCGTGYFTRLLQGEGAKAFGVDADLGRLLVASGISLKEPLPAYYLCADLTRLPLRDDSFDLVIMVTVLEFLGDREAALAEVRRVLRPGGRLVVLSLRRGGLWHLGRRLRRRLPYSRATLQTNASLEEMLAPIGPVSTIQFLYAPPWPFLPEVVFFTLDALIRRLCPGLASMVGAVVERI